MWRTWSPTWQHSSDDFNETAASFDNPDWADITLHSYRSRWGQAEGDPRYRELEERLAAMPSIDVPTLVLHGEADAVSLPASSLNKEAHFTNRYKRIGLPNVGHFPQREAPNSVAKDILAWLKR
jgi:pimeloyl-ACP methyl ester carboxylesterase